MHLCVYDICTCVYIYAPVYRYVYNVYIYIYIYMHLCVYVVRVAVSRLIGCCLACVKLQHGDVFCRNMDVPVSNLQIRLRLRMLT